MIGNSWDKVLSNEFKKEYFGELLDFIIEQ